ncbi:MAG: MarC family NAAT transporter [Candidatus Synoicihabitans palmerolidicus]|nr:MarC family NAAT transporter [Candidatus Synoicihabitans palmerolidicus]
MSHLIELFITTVAALFPITTPFGNAAILQSLTQSNTTAERHDFARRGALYMVAILTVFFIGGNAITSFFGISIAGIRIAGGLVITRFGFGQLTPRREQTHSDAEHAEASNKADIAFSPLTMPLLAGPGAIAAVMTVFSTIERTGFEQHLAVFTGIVVGGIISWLILRESDLIMQKLGVIGANAVTKIMGFLLLCIGVQLVIDGVLELKS